MKLSNILYCTELLTLYVALQKTKPKPKLHCQHQEKKLVDLNHINKIFIQITEYVIQMDKS